MASFRSNSRSNEEVQRGKRLVDAARTGDRAEIEVLLAAGTSVNADEYNKSLFYASLNYETPLQVAAAHGRDECVELLIERGADLNARDRFDVTAIHMASEQGNYACLKLLLEAGSDCNVATKYSKTGCYTATPHPGGTTPLHLAAGRNHIACVKELIQNGADYNAVDEQGRTSLYIAADAGLEDCVLIHLNNAIGRDILSLPVTKTGETPLHACVGHYLINCVHELLRHGSDPNHRNLAGNSPLHYCASYRSGDKRKQRLCFEIMKELILHGFNADVNLSDAAGLTPLHLVSFTDGGRMDRRPEWATFLIAYGADPNIQHPRLGNSLIEYELRNGNDCTILKAIIKSLPRIPSLSSLKLAAPAPPQIGAFEAPVEIELFVNGAAGDGPVLQGNSRRRCSWAKYQWYKQLAGSPRSLQHCCRCAVRRALGYRRLKLITDLPIPTSLKEYLLLEYDEFK